VRIHAKTFEVMLLQTGW